MVKNGQAVIPFKKYIEQRMTPYQFAVPLLIAVIGALFSAAIIFIQYADSNKNFIESISPHIATLLETQDGPEIQRFLKSISSKQGTFFEVVSKDKEILASSMDPSRIGTNFNETQKEISFLDLKLSGNSLINTAQVARSNGPVPTGAELVAYMDLSKIIYVAVGISIAIFVLSFFVMNWVIAKIINISKESLLPLSELEKAIRLIEANSTSIELEHSRIYEIESIKTAFVEAFHRLHLANTELTKSKAKELATVAYKNLIHDLHVPVTALRNYIKIMGLERTSKEEKETALIKIVELAEQILKQVRAARSHLSLDVTFKNTDIIESVVKATNDAQVALFDKPNIEVQTQTNLKDLNLNHDPVMLGRAISNLVSNAIESANHSVLVEVLKENENVSIKVSDDGKGLSQEEVSLHLQGRGKSTKAERMGIGLSSANHIVRSHGGKIIYKQSSMGGACFEIQLQGVSV